MSNRFVLADPHLGHKKIHMFRNKPNGSDFASADEHDEFFMDMWTTYISKKDVIYVLGDVAFNDVGLERFRKLSGTKIVVLGNHDLGFHKLAPICSKVTAMEMKCVNGHHVIMTHIPIHFTQLERWEFNIHGHIHGQPDISPRHRNVAMERIEFIPRLLEEVIGVY